MLKRNLLFLLLLIGCAPVRVQYDYDPGAVFGNYSSYSFTPELNTGLSELDERRLLQAVGTVLQSRGFQLSEDPDMVLVVVEEVLLKEGDKEDKEQTGRFVFVMIAPLTLFQVSQLYRHVRLPPFLM